MQVSEDRFQAGSGWNILTLLGKEIYAVDLSDQTACHM
jgi:hypothetical protein